MSYTKPVYRTTTRPTTEDYVKRNYAGKKVHVGLIPRTDSSAQREQPLVSAIRYQLNGMPSIDKDLLSATSITKHYVVDPSPSTKNEGLKVVVTNPVESYLVTDNQDYNIVKGWIWDSNINRFVTKNLPSRGEYYSDKLEVIDGHYHLIDPKGNTVKVPVEGTAVYPEVRGIIVRLFWYRGKMWFATGARILEANPDTKPTHQVYDTNQYMYEFFRISGLRAEDLFDTRYVYSNKTYSFLLETPTYSKITYKPLTNTVYFMSVFNGFSGNSLGLTGDQVDSKERYVNKLPTIEPFENLTDANAFLLNGYTNNPALPLELSGGEPVLIETFDNGVYSVLPTSFLWRRQYQVALTESLKLRYADGVAIDPKFSFGVDIVGALELADVGNLTWLPLGDVTDEEEAKVICFALSCNREEQKQLRSIMEEISVETEYLYDKLTDLLSATYVNDRGDAGQEILMLTGNKYTKVQLTNLIQYVKTHLNTDKLLTPREIVTNGIADLKIPYKAIVQIAATAYNKRPTK